jgi:hypothetical protein
LVRKRRAQSEVVVTDEGCKNRPGSRVGRDHPRPAETALTILYDVFTKGLEELSAYRFDRLLPSAVQFIWQSSEWLDKSVAGRWYAVTFGQKVNVAAWGVIGSISIRA